MNVYGRFLVWMDYIDITLEDAMHGSTSLSAPITVRNARDKSTLVREPLRDLRRSSIHEIAERE